MNRENPILITDDVIQHLLTHTPRYTDTFVRQWNGVPLITNNTVTFQDIIFSHFTGTYESSRDFGFEITKTIPVISNVNEGIAFKYMELLTKNEGFDRFIYMPKSNISEMEIEEKVFEEEFYRMIQLYDIRKTKIGYELRKKEIQPISETNLIQRMENKILYLNGCEIKGTINTILN